MIRTQDIMKSLPLVASVLGDKYGVRVNIGGNSAYTDGKTINLPTLPLDCAATLLALARSYIDHESAHIRETDFEAVRNANLTPIQHHIWNILEDFRVEQKLAALFPGCRQHFRWLIEHHFTKAMDDEAGDSNPALSVLDWMLLTVRAWEVPAVGIWRDKEAAIVEQNFPGLLATMQPVLDRVQQRCRNTQEAIEYALELTDLLEQFVKQSHKKQAEQPDTPSTNERTDSDSQTEQDNLPASPLEKLLTATTDELPQLVGEWIAEELKLQQSETAYGGIEVARTESKAFEPLPETSKAEALQTTVALRTRLHGLLQTQTRQACIPGRRGKLDATRLHSLSVNNPRVFLKQGERQSISTAVHLLLDSSGSMYGARMDLAAQACYAVAVALERCKGVNVAVTAFPAYTAPDGNTNTVAPLVRHGERVHSRFDIQTSGGTPLAASLWWVMQTMCSLKEQRKIILILSDGMPSHISATEHALKQAQSLGFEVFGLGIQDNSMGRLLPTNSRSIHDLAQLAPAMFDLLQSALLNTTRG